MRTVQVVSFALLLSLSMLDGVKMQSESDCNYFQELESDKTYYVYSPRYPNNYQGENHCIWQTSSPYIVKINCTIDIPQSSECTGDNISVTSVAGDAHEYCGKGTFVYQGMDATIKFDSLYNTKGGTFLCTVRADCYCGWKNPTRIVGGTETGVNEYPMMAGLVDYMTRELYCGATIISNKDVVTAAHCVAKRDTTEIGIIVGEHDTSKGDETDATKLYHISKCTIHPDYDDNNNYNDIAICRIDGIIQYIIEVGPACLPFQHSCDSFGGSYVEELGWGITEFGGTKSDTLQGVQLSVITNAECGNYYKNVTPNELCTYGSGKDSCQMDSGGPALWENPSTYNIVFIGIISSGIGCASGIPAVCTRVGAYINWIISVTPDIQYCKVE